MNILDTPGEAVQEDMVAATCYAEGSYDEVVYCSMEIDTFVKFMVVF